MNDDRRFGKSGLMSSRVHPLLFEISRDVLDHVSIIDSR